MDPSVCQSVSKSSISNLTNHFLVRSRCGRKGTIFEPVWADLEDFQTIQISGLMWEDHMPDFVLKALNQCLPSKEQEESILCAPDLPCSNTLEVPLTGFVEPNHFLMPSNHTGPRSMEEGNMFAWCPPFCFLHIFFNCEFHANLKVKLLVISVEIKL